jgi:hypothetical protein
MPTFMNISQGEISITDERGDRVYAAVKCVALDNLSRKVSQQFEPGYDPYNSAERWELKTQADAVDWSNPNIIEVCEHGNDPYRRTFGR